VRRYTVITPYWQFNSSRKKITGRIKALIKREEELSPFCPKLKNKSPNLKPSTIRI
jgi:hypothetical protein